MTKKKKKPAVEIAMIQTAGGVKVDRALPAKIEHINEALRAKKALGLPVELSQAECRDMTGTTKDLKRMLDDPAALASRLRTIEYRQRVQVMVEKYLPGDNT